MSFLKNVRGRIFGDAVNDLTVQEAGVADELASAGKAFGVLMEQVGLAVASTQKALDKSSAMVAEEMCKTEVEMIRARQTIYDDDGNANQIKIVTGKGRLIELASPVFYEQKFVSLQGEFSASEMATSSKTKVRQFGASVTASGGAPSKKGKKKGGIAPSVSGSVSASSSDVESGTSFDSSVGTMRMNALLAPKDATVIPKPILTFTGIEIDIVAGNTAINAAGDRTTEVTISVMKRAAPTASTPNPASQANVGKLISVDTDGVDWEYVGTPTTDGDGKLVVRLIRKQAASPNAPALESKKIEVSARLGLKTVRATVTV
jgi:hypothetical protein